MWKIKSAKARSEQMNVHHFLPPEIMENVRFSLCNFIYKSGNLRASHTFLSTSAAAATFVATTAASATTFIRISFIATFFIALSTILPSKLENRRDFTCV